MIATITVSDPASESEGRIETMVAYFDGFDISMTMAESRAMVHMGEDIGFIPTVAYRQ